MARKDSAHSALDRTLGRVRKLGQNALVRETLPLLLMYWLYSLVRWLVAFDGTQEAFANASKVIQWEQQLGIFFEPVIQGGVIHHAMGMVQFANSFYTFGYFPVLVLSAISLYYVDRQRFHVFKLTFLLGLGFALVCFSLFPLAPPRLIPQQGFIDTQQVYGSDLYHTKSVTSLYNPYAAMPSLHFGWAFLVGMMAFTSDRRALKVIGVFYPICMAFVIIITGHHYILDIVGGGVVVGLAHGLAKAFPRLKSISLPLAPARR